MRLWGLHYDHATTVTPELRADLSPGRIELSPALRALHQNPHTLRILARLGESTARPRLTGRDEARGDVDEKIAKPAMSRVVARALVPKREPPVTPHLDRRLQ